MSDLFKQLQEAKADQEQVLQRAVPLSIHQEKPRERTPQKATQVSNRLSKTVSKPLSKPLTTEDIEDLAYHLRKQTKARVNADIPEEWKKRLDDLAHDLGVGKYDLLMYVVGVFLGEVEQPEP